MRGKKSSSILTVGSRIKISKNKTAKIWKILGVIKLLPLFNEKEQGEEYIIGNKKRTIHVEKSQILAVVKPNQKEKK
ncbi:MAG: hypothetical protein PHO62_07670 [Sulfurimonas sp.]|uniref:hypothetical protein n=1 Tax=Sulfurimonas sp. TaxID=2022749 RepID=UPI002618B3A4|nr:hypothetical protein [Sulfurimonas sp.]MDD5373284.1 hypothetical protein [Sulfurimonas sp.]